jgi:hypothetical protein
MATTDNLWAQAGYVGHRKPLVRQGVELCGWPEGASEPFPGIPCKKVLKMRLYRLVTPLIRRQL